MTPFLTMLLNFLLKITLRYYINCADLAIGSFLSGHTLLVRSRPVVTLKSSLTTNPKDIKVHHQAFSMTICFQYDGHRVPEQIGEMWLISTNILMQGVELNILWRLAWIRFDILNMSPTKFELMQVYTVNIYATVCQQNVDKRKHFGLGIYFETQISKPY